jgi:hypothetical protein
MKKITFELPKLKDCSIEIKCLEEMTPIKGNAMQSGDENFDKKACNTAKNHDDSKKSLFYKS